MSNSLKIAVPASLEQEFAQKGFVVIPGFCSSESAHLLAESMLIQRDLNVYLGKRTRDRHVREAFSIFGHFDFALRYWLDRICSITGIPELVPVNSYSRIYYEGATLKRHTDRPELEVSATICLKKDPDSDWNVCVRDYQGGEHQIVQQDGDALIYRGDLVHWREGAFSGSSHSQLFLHYCCADSVLAGKALYAGRPLLGLVAQTRVPAARLHRLWNAFWRRVRPSRFKAFAVSLLKAVNRRQRSQQ